MSGKHLDVDIRSSGNDFELIVREQINLDGVTAVFGPSGGGKSTLLRAIGGFDRTVQGSISFGRAVWNDSDSRRFVPPHRRPVGTLFQDTRLFPHLDVAGNLNYAARRCRQHLPGFAVDDVVGALDLGGLMNRAITGLSGGERQRVALGRTLLTAPELLLLDEPLSALDQARKAEILPYLDALPTRFGIPTLYVSHDIDEVAHLADRVLVLADGRVQAHGPTTAVLQRLDLEPVMGRFEAGVLVDGTVAGHDVRLHLTRIDLEGETLTISMQNQIDVGTRVRLRIRARDVAIATSRPEGLSIRNVLPGTLDELVLEPEIGAAEVLVDVGGTPVRARLTLAAVEELGLEPGNSVFVLIKSVSFDPTS